LGIQGRVRGDLQEEDGGLVKGQLGLVVTLVLDGLPGFLKPPPGFLDDVVPD
jgi:hypothetical protein